MEVTGFWIVFSGLVLALSSMCSSEKRIQWIEEKLHIPWYVQIFTPMFGILLTMIGFHIWGLGNQGRYPGYPLDLLIEWFR